jgi:hypothetical protein
MPLAWPGPGICFRSIHRIFPSMVRETIPRYSPVSRLGQAAALISIGTVKPIDGGFSPARHAASADVSRSTWVRFAMRSAARWARCAAPISIFLSFFKAFSQLWMYAA